MEIGVQKIVIDEHFEESFHAQSRERLVLLVAERLRRGFGREQIARNAHTFLIRLYQNLLGG